MVDSQSNQSHLTGEKQKLKNTFTSGLYRSFTVYGNFLLNSLVKKNSNEQFIEKKNKYIVYTKIYLEKKWVEGN